MAFQQSLQIRLSQQLALTPQLQQSIRLLQMSHLEMMQEISALMADNPLLEYTEDFSETSPQEATLSDAPYEQTSEQQNESTQDLDDARFESEVGDVKIKNRNDSGEDEDDWQAFQTSEETLTEHLEKQLQFLNLSDRDRGLCVFIIENLDEDGYLRTSLEELHPSLPADLNFSLDELYVALCWVQRLEPLGVAARSIEECLTLQLQNEKELPMRNLALEIVAHYLPLLANKDFATLKRELNENEENIKAAQLLILKQNPKPGANFGQTQQQYIVPEVVVRRLKNTWKAYINPNVYPRLRVNSLYASAIKAQREGHDMGCKLQEAKWLVKNIEQRFDTILRVSQAIVERQRAFFEYGEQAMRPLILKEIAQEVDLHESTVSRVTAQKYMATPRGVFELKYFFGGHVATDSGGEYSVIATRAMIKKIIQEEDKKKPLSDAKISALLAKQGIMVARRTVAKYREALGLGSVVARKME